MRFQQENAADDTLSVAAKDVQPAKVKNGTLPYPSSPPCHDVVAAATAKDEGRLQDVTVCAEKMINCSL